MDLDSFTGPAGGNLTRADGLWFDDCGLVIQAQNTIFRVSRAQLATHSPIFRDMLSIPTPADAEMLEGCPLVRLPDTAEDITVFLKALFYYDFFEAFPAETNFEVLAGVLRMSHKYDVDTMRKRALTHLSSAHPMKLHDWGNKKDGNIPDLEKFSIEIVLLARQLSIDWILPTALYRLSTNAAVTDVLTSEMTLHDKISWVSSTRLMETKENNSILDCLWSPLTIEGCSSPLKCRITRITCRRYTSQWAQCSKDLLPNMPLDIWVHEDWNRLDVCGTCASEMKRMHQEALQSFWDRLPEIFGLPSWDELEKTKNEALGSNVSRSSNAQTSRVSHHRIQRNFSDQATIHVDGPLSEGDI